MKGVANDTRSQGWLGKRAVRRIERLWGATALSVSLWVVPAILR
jgi:hypothetical protein